MKKIFFTLIVILGVTLTTKAQTTIDSIDFTQYDTNYTKVVNYVGDSIVVHTKNKKSAEILSNTYGLVEIRVGTYGSYKFIYQPKAEARLVTNLTGIPYFIHRVILNK